LAKPPFRFIFDIVFAVFESTGFGHGLFTNEEKDSEMVKEKDQKIAWLDKLINLIGVFLNSHVAAKSKSIVAGLEPELTNEMLQMLAIAATLPGSGNNSTEAVRSVLAGEIQPDAHGARVQVNIAALAPGVVAATTSASDMPLSSATSSETNAKIAAEQSTKRAAERPQNEQPIAQPANSSSMKPTTVSTPSSTSGLSPTSSAPSLSIQGAPPSSTAPSTSSSSGPSSVPARPHTARRRPPRIDAGADTAAGNTAAASTTGGGAFFVEGKDDDSDGDGADDLLAGHVDGGDFPISLGGEGGGDQTVHGKHTREILAEREQQQQLAKMRADSASTADDAESGGVRLGKLRTKASGSAGGQRPAGLAFGELEGLQEAIQKLARSVTPVGNSLDFIPEDADEMRAELRAWRGDYQSRKEQQEKEARETEEALAPFKRQLADAEEKIRGQAGKIAAVKDAITKNDARIAELLRLVVTK
jgi:TRAF3-interacting protein 1